MRYLVIVEKGPTSYGAYVPHLEGLKDEGQPTPPPSSTSALVEVEAV